MEEVTFKLDNGVNDMTTSAFFYQYFLSILFHVFTRQSLVKVSTDDCLAKT